MSWAIRSLEAINPLKHLDAFNSLLVSYSQPDQASTCVYGWSVVAIVSGIRFHLPRSYLTHVVFGAEPELKQITQNLPRVGLGWKSACLSHLGEFR
jgi:hypothetical protein